MSHTDKTLHERQDDVAEELSERFFSDELVDGEEIIEILRSTPGAVSLLVLREIVDDDIDSARYEQTERLIEGLASVIMEAADGDAKAANQLKAIEKLIKPEKFELPHNKIQEIIDGYETSAPLARGWELLRLMSALSSVIEPLHLDRAFSFNEPIRIRDEPEWFDQSLWDLARKHLTPNATLQSLAIRIYLENLHEEGVTDQDGTITGRTLKRDLVSVRQWVDTASEDEKRRRVRYRGFSKSPITWFDFSEGWKERKKARKAKKVAPKSNR